MNFSMSFLALVLTAGTAYSVDIISKNFHETERAYFFDMQQADGFGTRFMPKKDVRIEERGVDDAGRIQLDANLFFQKITEADLEEAKNAVPAWRNRNVLPYSAYVDANCMFNREIPGEIKATSPWPARQGTNVLAWGVKFCRFGVLFKDSQENRAILAEAARDQTLITSGIAQYRINLQNTLIPKELDAPALHKMLFDAFGDESISVSEAQALFLLGVSVAKVYDQEIVAAIGQEENGEALKQLLNMVFVEQGGKFGLKEDAPDGENPVVKVIGTKTIDLDI